MKPIDIKKVILMLLASGILGVHPTLKPEAEGMASVVLGAKLMRNQDGQLLLDDDSCWYRIPTREN